jgi:hypothetical protein
MSMAEARLIIAEMAANAPDRVAVLEDIRTLSAAPAPLLETVERTLADGYACALAMDAHRLRLQRKLEESAAVLGETPGSERVVEVADLAQGIARSDRALAELRAALAELAAKAQRLRAA